MNTISAQDTGGGEGWWWWRGWGWDSQKRKEFHMEMGKRVLAECWARQGPWTRSSVLTDRPQSLPCTHTWSHCHRPGKPLLGAALYPLASRRQWRLLLSLLILKKNHKQIMVFYIHATAAAAAAKSSQSCLTLCNPTGGSPPGSSVPGILQARILEWVAISFSIIYMYIIIKGLPW